nr:glycine oxidase-like [Nerophis lumbriciformis]
MDRRKLLKLLSAAALTGCVQRTTSSKPLRVVVAGAGIVGASIAFHLAKAGASVVVIDKQGPATHASRGTFAWINATWAKQPRSYHRLTQESVSYWRELQQLLKLPVRWGGSLEWFDSSQRQQLLAEQIAEQAQWGEPARMIDAAELAELEPQLRFESNGYAAYSPNDGTVDPVLATNRLLAAAEALGATVQYPNQLLDVGLQSGRLTSVEASNGSIKADRLVIATGAAAEIPQQIGDIDIPQRTTPGIITTTKPMSRLLNRVISTPGVHMHQRNDSRIVIGEPTDVWQNAAHSTRLGGRPNNFPARAFVQQHGRRMIAAAAQYVPEISQAEVEHAFIGWRPLPLDGHPVLGPSPARPDVYLAIMHSGVSLAPVVGKLAARELVASEVVRRLVPFRPARTFEAINRY